MRDTCEKGDYYAQGLDPRQETAWWQLTTGQDMQMIFTHSQRNI